MGNARALSASAAATAESARATATLVSRSSETATASSIDTGRWALTGAGRRSIPATRNPAGNRARAGSAPVCDLECVDDLLKHGLATAQHFPEILAVGSVLRVGNVSFEHEVLTRGELMQRHDMLGLDSGTSPREPRIARS